MVTTANTATGFPGMAGMGAAGAGLFGPGPSVGSTNPYAGMNPYTSGMGMPQGMPSPPQMPPWQQAGPQVAGAGGQGQPPPWLQQIAAMQAMNQAGQGQMPQGMPPGAFGGILSGMMGMGGGMPPWAQGQSPQGRPRQQLPQPARAPRRATYGGGSAGNISLSGY